MSVAISPSAAAPRGAGVVERVAWRVAASLSRWVERRAQTRADRRERMLASIQHAQTVRPDPRAAVHLLAQAGLPER